MSHLNLTPDRWLTDGYDDPGIFHTPGKPGKESRTRHQSKNQCFDPPVVAFRSPEKFLLPVISPETGKAMTMDRRYRRTNDHSPVFSLFTFFP
jgi:hypothetical protein